MGMAGGANKSLLRSGALLSCGAALAVLGATCRHSSTDSSHACLPGLHVCSALFDAALVLCRKRRNGPVPGGS